MPPPPQFDPPKVKLMEQWVAYPTEGIIKACKSFQKRVEAAITADELHV